MEKWAGKTAVVTGASSGIGDAIVRDFVKHGINVVALARREERLQALKEQLKDCKGEVIPMKCDVSDKSSVDRVFSEIEKKFGVIHILVNNAGVGVNSSILGDEDSIDEAIEKTINTNFLGLVKVTRKAYKLMKKSNDYGIIINIGSILGHSNAFTRRNANVYIATKHAVRSVSDTMRHDLVKFNDLKVRVCEISPGTVDTEIFDVGGWNQSNSTESFVKNFKVPALTSSEFSQTVLLVLLVPYNVNITEMIVKPVGEKL